MLYKKKIFNINNLQYSFHNESYFLQIIYSFPRIPYSYLQC